MTTFEEHLEDHQSGYIEHPLGWNDLVEQMHAEIVALDPDYMVAQTKEKFGGLRFYIDISSDVTDEVRDEIETIVEFYEAKSYGVCQDCGDKGTQERNTGEFQWVATLCQPCRRKRNNR